MRKYIRDCPAPQVRRKMLDALARTQRVQIILHALAGGVLAVIEVFALRYVTGLLSTGNRELQQILYVIGAYAIIASFCKVLQTQSRARGYASLNSIRMHELTNLVTHVMTMDLKYYENPEFMDEVDAAMAALRSNDNGLEGIYHRLFPIGSDLAAWLALSLIMVTLSPWLLLFLIAAVLAHVYAAQLVANYRARIREELSSCQRRTRVYGERATDFSYGKDTRLFGMTSLITRYCKAETQRLMELLKFYFGIDTRANLLRATALVAGDAFALLVLLRRVQAGMPLDWFVLYLSTMAALTLIIMRLGNDLSFVLREFKDVQTMYGFLATPLISASSTNRFQTDVPPSITFEGVSFRYPNTEQNVLEELSFHLDAGKKLALVGVNGAGKTTLIKLLTGLYRPDSGRILINGIDYREFSLDDLRRLFAVVFQEVEPIAVTVAQNVAARMEGIDRELVQHCLEQAGLWEKVSSLPNGMDSQVLKIVAPDGIVFSGGENQKLMIARALYRTQARIMIMDEPTAALDALAEAKIYEEFNQLLNNRTAIFISHRLASTRFCDEIMLLNGGTIAERGTHEELMGRNGLYAEMFREQSKYYRVQEVGAND